MENKENTINKDSYFTYDASFENGYIIERSYYCEVKQKRCWDRIEPDKIANLLHSMEKQLEELKRRW